MTTMEPPATSDGLTAAPPSTPSAQVERPPAGLAQGRFAAPPWLIGTVAVALFLAVIAYFVVRHRRAKRVRAYESVAPQSTPQSSRR